MLRLFLTIAMLLALAMPSMADDTAEALVERWYAALIAADRAQFNDLLTNDATIVLEDIELEQNKQEFLNSLGEWENAAKGATIRHRFGAMENGKLTAFVCYQFPESTTYTRELFTFRDGKVSGSTQGSLGETCEGF
ncbi:nuclear transport factor 2 family protein [Phyllobacterium sp. 628]|uniref:nuclear transport factor 2 family protein n=1 Tax=Phyllobacterium sp. 628 TaxID=2718938 RepID=UPI0016624879|nr:nuclear transport factor 2 family protein [Phyllobacterium sp. 628]QND51073.1 nuclear transport factor 2 family protein [Phyllobacterium sp. 628]